MEHKRGRNKSTALTGNQRLILVEILNGSQYNRQIARATELDYSVVSREVSNLEDLGLLAKERQDTKGRVRVLLNPKGKMIANTLEDVTRLEESITRMLQPPVDDLMTLGESEVLRSMLGDIQRSSEKDALDNIVALYAFLNGLRERGILYWYADDLLFNFLLNLPSKDMPPRAKIRSLSILNDVMMESCLNPIWGKKLRPVVPKLVNLVVDETLDDDVRLRALQTYSRFREPDGSVPECVLKSFYCHLWHYVTPGYKSFYMEDIRILENMNSLSQNLSPDQMETLVSSVECLKAPSMQYFDNCIQGKRMRGSRGVDYKRWQELEHFINRRKEDWRAESL